MRQWLAIAAAVAIGMMTSADVSSVAAPTSKLAAGETAQPAVDVELVLAVDVSYSMDIDELALQREGYAEAITSREFLQALKQGPNGRIVVTYFEWAAAGDQKIIVPWRVVDGPEAADALSAEIHNAPLRRASRTSISGAINFAVPLFDDSGHRGLRRVIDISGDGPNNSGPPVTEARDAALARGITINGLPIMLKAPTYSTMDIDHLDYYYEDCVTGGIGSFVVPIQTRETFKEAIRTKLVQEVAGLRPEPPRVVPAAAAGEPRVLCSIGERIWQDRWGR
ncbi:DUF1194 domain-containing protein [Bradyrhizobium sp. WD16]|uniref:DUF1194 domain-containing protein n=1 Tax=Bradyrhizobium sp. WD16 TaxID=1521768 RepID=UPI0020A46401|nr:DUF1194 domain-containing protein [Bradyrhizobium sp. WD16]UTD25610.1 hypothetical protein DB459_00495 [Bradyrhizobium sp. WD16]